MVNLVELFCFLISLTPDERAISLAEPILSFVEWFKINVPRRTVSLRDVLAWADFASM